MGREARRRRNRLASIFAGAVAAAMLLVASAAWGASPAAAQEFRVSPIDARFNQPGQSTEYEVLVTAPPGSKFTFTWTGPNCGDFRQPDPTARPNLFFWHHPHPPCDPTTGHQSVTIVVEITDGKTNFRCTYQGAETGVGPACTTSQVTSAPGAPVTTTTPVRTTPVTESTATTGGTTDGSNAGLWAGLGLGALVLMGGGYFAYTRSRAGVTTGDPWEGLRYQEQVQQEGILRDFKAMLDDVNAAWAAYRKAVDTFRSRYCLALSASTEMQGLLVQWAEVKGVAQKQDLAFAIVTLLWSGGSLALKGLRWIRGGQAAAAGTEAAATGARVGETAAATTEVAGQGAKSASRSEFFGKYIELVTANETKNLARMAEEAGMTMAEATARWGDHAMDVGVGLSELLAQQRGWVTMTVEAEATIGRLLVNGRSAIAGRAAALAAEDVATIQRWAQQPGFWERLGKAAGHMDEIGWAGERPEIHEFIGLLYNADDIAFLKHVVEAGGDLSKLRAAVGPAQTAVLGSMDSTLAGVVLNAPTGLAAAGAAGLASQSMGDPIGQLGSLTNFVDQFGVTNKIDSMPLPKFIGSELWALVSSPFETYHRYSMTNEAMNVWDQFMANHAGTLTDMSNSLNDAVHAMERMQRALERHGVGDLSSRFTQRAAALRDILRQMGEFQEGHGGEYEERRAHIEQKLAQIEHTCSALAAMEEHVGLMLDWLQSMRDSPDGGRRSLFDMVNPEIAVRLVSIQSYLDMGMSAAYRNDPGGTAVAPPPSTPPAAPMQTYETPPPVTPLSDEEMSRRWLEQVQSAEEQWKTFEAAPETGPLPDNFFDGLDDAPPPPTPGRSDGTGADTLPREGRR